MPYVRESLVDHIADKFTVGDGCWEWTGTRNDSGYGVVRKQRAHRAVYELMVGPIPDRLTLDHLCRNRACVRPDHLEPVTREENVRRGIHGGNALKTHCPAGHLYDAIRPNGRYLARRCTTCEADRRRARRIG